MPTTLRPASASRPATSSPPTPEPDHDHVHQLRLCHPVSIPQRHRPDHRVDRTPRPDRAGDADRCRGARPLRGGRAASSGTAAPTENAVPADADPPSVSAVVDALVERASHPSATASPSCSPAAGEPAGGLARRTAGGRPGRRLAGPAGSTRGGRHAGQRLLGRQAGRRALPADPGRPEIWPDDPVARYWPGFRPGASGVCHPHRRAAGLPGAPAGHRDRRLGAAHRRPGRRRAGVAAGLGGRRTRLDVRAPGRRAAALHGGGGPVPGRGHRRPVAARLGSGLHDGCPTSRALRRPALRRPGMAGPARSASPAHCGRGRHGQPGRRAGPGRAEQPALAGRGGARGQPARHRVGPGPVYAGLLAGGVLDGVRLFGPSSSPRRPGQYDAARTCCWTAGALDAAAMQWTDGSWGMERHRRQHRVGGGDPEYCFTTFGVRHGRLPASNTRSTTD